MSCSRLLATLITGMLSTGGARTQGRPPENGGPGLAGRTLPDLEEAHMTSLGHQFASAIGRRDRPALRSLLSDGVDFKGLTPGRVWEADSPDAVDEVVFGHWFEEADEVAAVRGIDEGVV